MSDKPLTGRTVLIITVAAFSVIIAVNLTMAFLAAGSFPGLEVENSYIASQEFDERREAQERLGWIVESSYENGELVLTFANVDGGIVIPEDFTVLIGRTTESKDDMRPEFSGSTGRYVAPIELARGKWMMLVEAKAQDGTEFRRRMELYIRG